MSTDLTIPLPSDPATLGWPPTLAIEIALKTHPVHEVCEMYGIDRVEWQMIRADPRFIQELTRATAMLREEGMSFKIKAKLQAEEMLKESWRMVHDTSGAVPPSVKADLIKFTVRAAGLSEEKPAAGAAGAVAGLSISINLG